MFLLIFTRLVLDGIAGIKFMIALKPRHTFAIIKAHFGFYGVLAKMLKKRKGIKQQSNYYHTKSIVWDYFIRGKKKFILSK